MFDDPSLKISEHYFAVLQILRTMGEWIAESIEDIEDMKQTWDTWQKEWLPVWRVAGVSEEMKIEDGETIALNWAVLASRQRNLGKKLLDKIDRTTEEVKLLRDGVSPSELGSLTLANNNRHSCSTPLPSKKPPEEGELTKLSSSSPS
jgi:hypothetical protein